MDEIIIKPTVNESNAAFAFRDGNDSALTDADTSQDDYQVSLAEGANTIKVKVTAEDTSTTATYTVTVARAPNAAPTFTNGASTSLDFNETIGDAAVSTASNIGTPVAADTLAYTLEGTDAAKFGIIPTNGQIQTKAGERYLHGDGGEGANAAPTFTNGASTSLDFNETIGDAAVSTASNIGTPVAATDTDAADTLAYTLEGTDAAKFGIIPTNGQIQTKAGERYDYEAKSSYAVTVTFEDGNGGSDTIAVTLDSRTRTRRRLRRMRPR